MKQPCTLIRAVSPLRALRMRTPCTPFSSPSTSSSSCHRCIVTLPSAARAISLSTRIGSARKRSRRWIRCTRLARLARYRAPSTAVLPPPTTHTSCPRKKNPSPVEPFHQLRALHPVGIGRPVVDVRRGRQLAALCQTGDQSRGQVGARRIDGGRVAGRSGSEDQHARVACGVRLWVGHLRQASFSQYGGAGTAAHLPRLWGFGIFAAKGGPDGPPAALTYVSSNDGSVNYVPVNTSRRPGAGSSKDGRFRRRTARRTGRATPDRAAALAGPRSRPGSLPAPITVIPSHE